MLLKAYIKYNNELLSFVCFNFWQLNNVQYSPKIIHAQELLFASTRRTVLLAGDCGSLELESWKPQELLCGCMLKAQELLCGRMFEPQELLCGSLCDTSKGTRQGTRK